MTLFAMQLNFKASETPPYLKLVTPKKKAEIAKYAAENGILESIRHFSKEFPDNTLKESAVRGWKAIYLNEFAGKKNSGCKEVEVTGGFTSSKDGSPIIDWGEM